MPPHKGVRERQRQEVEHLTGYTPTIPYNHLANTENQKKIVENAVEARKHGMSYGKYVAQKYLSEHRITSLGK